MATLSSKLVATIAGLAASSCVYYLTECTSCGIRIPVKEILSVFISVSVTLLGFGMATLSILTALTGNRLVSNMIKTGHFEQLVKELFFTSAAFFVVLVLGMMILFLPESMRIGSLIILTGMFIAAVVLLASSGNKFYKVLKYLK